jgi:hypothetical protein
MSNEMIKELDLTKDELLEHIEMLNKRYEPIIERENDESKWMDDWDECTGKVRCGILGVRRELIDCETFSIPKDDLIEGRKKYDTPIEWLSECIGDYYEDNRYNNGESFHLMK